MKRSAAPLVLFRLWILAVIAGMASAQVAFASGPILQVTADGSSSVRPSWSPDGTHIAFQTSEQNAYHVYTMAADGSDVKRLTDGDGVDSWPTFCPDGKRIAFVSNRAGNYEIELMNADGSGRENLTAHPSQDTSPAWSPDGRRLAFVSTRDGGSDVYVSEVSVKK